MNDTNIAEPIASPCINVCRMDAQNLFCQGCLRTVDEICAWAEASREERLAILAEIEKRRRLLALP